MLINDIPNLTDSESSNALAFSNGYLSQAIAIASADLQRIIALRDLDHATSVVLSCVVRDLNASASGAEKAASDLILRLRKSAARIFQSNPDTNPDTLSGPEENRTSQHEPIR